MKKVPIRSPSHSKLGPHFEQNWVPMALGSSVWEGYVGVSPQVFFEKVFLRTPYALQLVMQCRLWCIAGWDALQVMMHWRRWCTEAGDALEVVMHWRWWCTEGGDALQVVMHFLLIHRFLLSALVALSFFYFKVWELYIVFPAPIFDCCTPVADYQVLGK